MNIYEKLANVQNELKAPKSQYNSFGKYSYRSCEDILEAVKPVCKVYEALIILHDEIVLIGDRYYVKATATFMDAKDGSHVETSAYAREENEKKGMDGSQLTGATSSYARKYALNGLLQIDDSKDADTDQYANQQNVTKKASTPTSSTTTNNNVTTTQKPIKKPQPKPQSPVQQSVPNNNQPQRATIPADVVNGWIRNFSWLDPLRLEGCGALNIDIERVAAYNKISVEQLTNEMLSSAIAMKTESLKKAGAM